MLIHKLHMGVILSRRRRAKNLDLNRDPFRQRRTSLWLAALREAAL